MNGFALVVLREIVLSSLPTASILSLRPSPPSQQGVGQRPSSGGSRRAITVRMEDGRRIDISHSARRRPLGLPLE